MSSHRTSSSSPVVSSTTQSSTNKIRISQLPKKLDGFLAIAEEWTFLGRGHTFSLPRSVVFTTISPDRLKGVQCLKGQNTTAVSLNRWHNLDLYQLVCAPPNVTIQYSILRSVFINSVDEAILLMGRLSCLYETVKTHICCNTYKKRQQQGCRTCDSKSEAINVTASEIERFGYHFQESFKRLLEENYPGVKTFLCCVEMGQSDDYNCSIKALNVLNFDDFLEVVLHIAADVESPVGQVYFWRRDKIAKLESIQSLKPYHTAFIARVGNFVLNINNSDKNQNSESFSADCQVLKFYSSILREQAKNKIKPFSYPVLGKMLADPLNAKETKAAPGSPELVLAWIVSLEESIRIQEVRQCNVIRCEAVISVCNPAQETSVMDDGSTRRQTARSAKHVFDEKLDTPIEPMIAKVSFEVLITHMKNTLLPLLNTLKMITEEYIQKRDECDFYLPPLETFLLASICECLLCFYIYGAASWREDKEMFPSKLVTALGLRQHKLFETGARAGNNSGIGMNSRPVFLSLESLGPPGAKFLRVSTYRHQNGKTMIKYEGRCPFIENKYCQPLQSVMGNIDWMAFVAIVKNFPQPDEPTFQEQMSNLCQMFWKMLQTVAFELLPCQPSLLDLCNLLEKEIQIIPDSSRDFVSRLFKHGCNTSQPIQRFINILRHSVPRQFIAQVVKSLTEFIEKQMYEGDGAFIFPAPSQETLSGICILPMFKLPNFDFDTLSMEQKNVIYNRYNQVCRKLARNAQFPSMRQYIGKVDWDCPYRGCIALQLAWNTWHPQ